MNTADCAAALREVLPEFGFSTVELAQPQGWAFWTFVADGEWIFRFPRDDEAARTLEREFAMLPVVGPRLSIAVPRYEWRGQWQSRPFGAYRRIEGQAFEPGAFTVPAIAGQLARALKDLHAIPIELVAARLDEPSGGERWIERQRAFHERCRRDAVPLLDPQLQRHFRDFEASFERHAAGEWHTALVHNDLGPIHILGDSTGLTGIIDWSDMAIGDPAVDFAGIAARSGEAAFRLVAHAYGRMMGGGFDARVRYYAAIAPLHDVLYALDTADPAILSDGIDGFASRATGLDWLARD